MPVTITPTFNTPQPVVPKLSPPSGAGNAHSEAFVVWACSCIDGMLQSNLPHVDRFIQVLAAKTKIKGSTGSKETQKANLLYLFFRNNIARLDPMQTMGKEITLSIKK